MSLEVEKLLELAAQVAPDRRGAFLAGQCPDPLVRAEVAALLQYGDDAESRFHVAIDAVAVSIPAGHDPSPGDLIGNYRIVSSIGRGGMGCVYLAERADGEIRRQVAIKLLRADSHRPEWRKRFNNERKLLASLHHPSIVHVVDAGQTGDGRPYLVMEYVEGVPIDRYAAGIDVRERLKLFIRVCGGVSHAHRRLIVHRDLKPSNILVDAAGEPKLLDFGIARLLSDAGDVTQTADRLMTPDYASPEQLSGEAQSTATDVYSLGAVLYRLVTGVSPRNWTRNTPQADAPPASRVNPAVPRDVDFILEKALREEPEYRYSSVDQLAADVQAVLDWRPVQARGGSLWYRARRNMRRHWIPLAAGLLIVASLTAGLLVANRERVIAERRFQDVRSLANKLFDIEYETRKIAGSTKVSQLIVDTSVEYLRRLASDVHGDPSLALELGNAYLRLARVQGVPTTRNLGRMDQAESSLGIAGNLVQGVLAVQPWNRTALLRMAQIAHDRMLLARYGGRYDEALDLARQSAQWLERFHPGVRDKAEASGILNAYLNVADQFARREQFDEALRLCRLGIDYTVTADRKDYVPDFLWISGDVHRRRGDLELALEDLDESVRLSGPVEGRDEVWRPINFALSLICRGDLLGEENAISMGRRAEALGSLERAFRIGDDLAHRDPNDQMSRSRVANAGISMAGILRDSDPARALEVYDHTFRHVAEIKDNTSFRRFEVTVLAGSSYALRKLGRPDEARRRLDGAFERLAQLRLYPVEQVRLGSETEDSLRALGEYEAGAANFPKAVATLKELLRLVQAGKSRPETSLTDAVRLSTIYRTAASIERLAGLVDDASDLEKRDRELWRQWSRALPGNPFVRRHLEAGQVE